MLFNKATGLYGLLAILTGYTLSATQLSMYIVNLVALVLLAFCIPHIRKRTPLQNLALAWLYIIDTAVNAVFTCVFAIKWYIAAEQLAPPAAGTTGAAGGDGADWMAPHETAASMVLITMFTLVRLYFTLVVMAHTSMVLQQHVEELKDAGAKAAGNPFATDAPAGAGWRGRLGRILVSVGREYWLGRKGGDERTQGTKSEFEETVPLAASAESED